MYGDQLVTLTGCQFQKLICAQLTCLPALNAKYFKDCCHFSFCLHSQVKTGYKTVQEQKNEAHANTRENQVIERAFPIFFKRGIFTKQLRYLANDQSLCELRGALRSHWAHSKQASSLIALKLIFEIDTRQCHYLVTVHLHLLPCNGWGRNNGDLSIF